MKRLVVHEEAERDLVATFAWYEEHRPWALEALRGEIEAALAGITEAPERYPSIAQPRPGHDVRCSVLQGAPYLVFFDVGRDTIVVLAIAHGRRRPGYWHERLR